jgi:acyl carrier protein
MTHKIDDAAALDLADEVRRVIVESAKLKCRPEEIRSDQPLHGPSSLGLHSLDIFELVLELETRLGVEIKDEEIPGLNSIAAIVALIESRRAG